MILQYVQFLDVGLAKGGIIRYGGGIHVVPPHRVEPSKSDRLITTVISDEKVTFRPRQTRHPTCLINDPRAHMARIDSCLSKVNCRLYFFTEYKSPYIELLRDIAAGEELFLDYGDNYWKGVYHRGTSRFFFIGDGAVRQTGWDPHILLETEYVSREIVVPPIPSAMVVLVYDGTVGF